MKRSTSVFSIPSGKRVRVYSGSLNDENAGNPIELMLTDTVNIPTSSSFSGLSNSISFERSLIASLGQMVSDKFSGIPIVSDALEYVSGLVGGLNDKLGYQIFTGSSPLNVSLNCSVQARTNAFEEVIDPVRRLQLMVAPRANDEGFLVDFPGPDAATALTGEAIMRDCSIKVGRFGFNHVLIKDVSTTFSTEVDQTGWPISATVQITFDTVYQLTQNMINEYLYRVAGEGTTATASQSEINKSLKWQDQGWS